MRINAKVPVKDLGGVFKGNFFFQSGPNVFLLVRRCNQYEVVDIDGYLAAFLFVIRNLGCLQ